MTEENYNYRTSSLFLRNEFDSKENWNMPVIPKPNIELDGDIRVIGFDRARNDKDNHYNRLVHFFLYDYEFEDIWKNPDKYVEILKKYKGVLSPDFSMYIEMNPVMQLYNTFRNRWVGAFLSKNGIKVIPTVNWGLEDTFDFCFNGIDKGSTVAVSTYMVSEHGNHSDQKDFFLKGYNEMLKRVEPEWILCYHTPFPEMQGNILYIDYELSSWRHYEDDACKGFGGTGQSITKYHSGYVLSCENKGTGSAFGGKWKPKKPEEERFFGVPGEIKHTFIPTSKGGYWVHTKIGDNGKATVERQDTDHGNSGTHSNPHDNYLEWDETDGHPIWSREENYFDGNIPEFKYYKVTEATKMTTEYNYDYKTKYEFKQSVKYHADIVFEWQGTDYGIFWAGEKGWYICLTYTDKDGEPVYYNTIDDLMNHKIGDDKLIDICTKFTVIERTF